MRKVDMYMAKDKVMDMDMEFDFDGLMGEVFGNKVTKVKLNPTIQGKRIAIYSPSNNVGKTRQASRFCKNTIFIPFEEGLNAISNGNALRTSSWADFRSHVSKLVNNKKLTAALEQGQEIGIVLDGMETMALFCKQYICDMAGKTKIQDIPHGGGWSAYETEMFEQITKISKTGFTLIFIGHAKPSKEDEGYMDFACDRRTSKPIKDLCDLCFYVEGNGVDEETGEVIPSSAWLNEHKGENGFFARSRFSMIKSYYEVFDAEIIKQAIYDGIVAQAEAEGAEIVSFKEAQDIYDSTFTLTYEEAMKAIYDMLDKCDELGKTEDADNILLSYVPTIEDVETLTKKQMQTIQSIHDELEELLAE